MLLQHAQFVADPRYRLDVLKLLQGDVHDDTEVPVLGRMRRVVREVEKNPRRAIHRYLGNVTANAFVEVSP